MSFILDALRKSETERQQQAGAEFSSVPSSSGEDRSYKWLWILAFLLLFNGAVLLGLLLRPGKAPDVATTIEAAPAQEVDAAASGAGPSFEERVAEARPKQPPPVTAAPEVVSQPQTRAQSAVATAPTRPAAGRVPTIDELRLNGELQLSELHLDIHVYSDDPGERFVFINMEKHREQSRLDEGPVVSEITPDGVVLEHQGREFLLPRE